MMSVLFLVLATAATGIPSSGASMASSASGSAAGLFCGTLAGCIYPYPTQSRQGSPGPVPPTFNPANFTTRCLPRGHGGCNVVTRALHRVVARIFAAAVHSRRPTQWEPASLVTGLVVTLTSATATPLQLGVNETYTLDVPAAGPAMVVSLQANTEWGALRGLESFGQSVTLVPGSSHGFFHDTTKPAYVLMLWPPARIQDSPRTAWRGLLIDTSRHFLSVPTVKKAIEAMAMAKMNTLHWHLVDGDGWPLCINATKAVCDQHAYRDPFGTQASYSAEDLKGVVAFATARGVRVVPEFDLPGHLARPLCATEPALCVQGCAPDPSSEAWWSYLERVVAELADIFPDDFFHGGADEFKADCWFESAGLKAWAAAHNMTTPTKLLDYFYIRWQTTLLQAGKRPMFWDEFFWVYAAATPTRTRLTVLPGTTATVRGITGYADAEYAGDQQEWANTLKAGIPAVSTGVSEMWYLDRIGKICSNQPDGVDPSLGTHNYFWQAWETYHDHDPFAHLEPSTLANRSLMLGGEVDMWGEGIDDGNFEPFVFPKASAAAERMWSFEAAPPGVGARLGNHRCAVVAAGVRAAPIGPGAPCAAVLT